MGNSNPNVVGSNYVKVTVEHQFIANTSMTLEGIKNKHQAMLIDKNGNLSISGSNIFQVVPNSIIEANHTCSKESRSRLIKSDYVISGEDEWGVVVGEDIEVNCEKEVQLFTKDIWDEGKFYSQGL